MGRISDAVSKGTSDSGRMAAPEVGANYWDAMDGVRIHGFATVEWDHSYARTSGRVWPGSKRRFLLMDVIDDEGRPDGWLAIVDEEVTSIDLLSDSEPIVLYYQRLANESSPVPEQAASVHDLLAWLESTCFVITVYSKSSGVARAITGSVEIREGVCRLHDMEMAAAEPTLIAIDDVQSVQWGHAGSRSVEYFWGDEVPSKRVIWDRGHEEFEGAAVWPVDGDRFSAWCKVDSWGRYAGLIWILDKEISSSTDTLACSGDSVLPFRSLSDGIFGCSSVRTFMDYAAENELLTTFYFIRTGAQELLVGRVHSIVGDQVRFNNVSPEGCLGNDYSVVAMENILAVEVDSPYLQMLDHVVRLNVPSELSGNGVAGAG